MADTGAGTHATVGSGLNPSPALLVGALGVFVVGLVARLVPLLRGGGLTGFNRYDDGVNFSGALGLVHGRLPYATFSGCIRQACSWRSRRSPRPRI